ncbi:hypothetical protein [Deefgea piscis]|uniref:hypothetical protein n=1 Tax=Deefgea piscis TaxID=2739061 RepID=UPI001C7FF0A6|nr:hypothetical protein [Deefgea piscis]QZA82039.1 hypothetical protein K4H25_05150 [Deefgea piscis]
MSVKVFKSIYNEARCYIPERLLYAKEYFSIKSILASHNKIQISALVEAQLKHVLLVCLRDVNFYKNNVAISLADIEHNDPFVMLKSFPIISKSDLITHKNDFLNRQYRKSFLSKSSSSGSSGFGVEVYRNKKSADIEKAFFSHHWGKFGFNVESSRTIRIGQDALRASSQRPTFRQGSRLMLSPTHISENNIDEIAMSILKFKPDFIHGYPSCIYQLACLLDSINVKIKVKAVLLASEPVFNSQLKMMKDVFIGEISANYGLSERTNLAFSTYKENEGMSYIFDELYSVNEFIDDELGTQIIGTSLWNEVMPLIRYQTQDYVKITSDNKIRIDGRQQHYLIAKDGSKIPSLIVDDVPWQYISQIQIKQPKSGCIILYVVLKIDVHIDDAIEFITNRQKAIWGEWFDVEIVVKEKLERTQAGKINLVIFD